MQKKTGFNKRKISVKTAAFECFNIIKNIDTKLMSVVISAVMLLSSFGIITKYYTVGYDVYYGDARVGVISSKEDAIEAYNEAQTDVIECDRDEFRYDLEFVMTITSVSAVNQSNIYRGIVEAAEGEESCYSINAGDITIAKVKTMAEAEEALRLYKESFGGKDAFFASAYSVSPSSDIITQITSCNGAVDALKASGILKVRHSVENEEVVAIPYNEIVIEDANLAKDLTVVKQIGSAGKGVKKTVTVYENGMAISATEDAMTVITEAVDNIVHVGTGDMVGLTKKTLPWPVDGTFTSDYGRRWGRNHNGIDIAAKTGTPIYAPCSGTVIYAERRSDYGNFVKIDHGNGYVTTYAHMNSLEVSEGDVITTGTRIGSVGTTGRVTGAHLHFEILINGEFTDPMNYIAG